MLLASFFLGTKWQVRAKEISVPHVENLSGTVRAYNECFRLLSKDSGFDQQLLVISRRKGGRGTGSLPFCFSSRCTSSRERGDEMDNCQKA